MVPIIAAQPSDADSITRLLDRVYVAAGFTDAAVAEQLFQAHAVFERGDVLVARIDDRLAGMVIVVPAASAARRLAAEGEVEMHLLAVAPEYRHVGLGGRLVQASLEHGRAQGASRMVLWTQPLMTAAHRLYERHGFTRATALDFERGGRSFLVFEQRLVGE